MIYPALQKLGPGSLQKLTPKSSTCPGQTCPGDPLQRVRLETRCTIGRTVKQPRRPSPCRGHNPAPRPSEPRKFLCGRPHVKFRQSWVCTHVVIATPTHPDRWEPRYGQVGFVPHAEPIQMGIIGPVCPIWVAIDLGRFSDVRHIQRRTQPTRPCLVSNAVEGRSTKHPPTARPPPARPLPARPGRLRKPSTPPIPNSRPPARPLHPLPPQNRRNAATTV
jgi:hypothetical protein